MMKNKNYASVAKDLDEASDLIEKHYDKYAVVAFDDKGMFVNIKIENNDGELSTTTLCEMITRLMLYSQTKSEERENEVGFTQGQLDLAYLMCADILQKLLDAGATDYADIAPQVNNGGDSWIEESDILNARDDEADIKLGHFIRKVVEKREEEGDDDEPCCKTRDCRKRKTGKNRKFSADDGENEKTYVLRSVRECRKFVNAVCDGCGALAKTMVREMTCDDFAGFGLVDKKTGKTIRVEIRLTDAQKSELMEDFGLEED